MLPSPHVRFDQVTFLRGEQAVFRNFSLSLSERRIGLIGPNGSGKSSLLRLVHGLARPTSGRVTTLGMDTVRDRKAIPSRVGFLFQNPDRQIIFPTVGEEIAFGFEERGRTRREAMRDAMEYLSRFDRSGWFERSVHDLSEGQKHLVCLISVLALGPKLILLDEPFASLDLHNRLAFAARLQALPQAIVMASHDLEFLETFDRILWLEGGELQADGPPSEVLPAYRAEARRRAEDPA